MKHYFIFKYGRIYFEKVYELHSDDKTAKEFTRILSKQYGCPLICCEVI